MNIIVIGGGPAGMMAAIAAARAGAKVKLLEKNTRCGEKLRISGGGRCNVTNNKETREILPKYGDAAPFLHSPFSIFDVESTKDFFGALEVEFHEENEGRMFPVTNRAETIAASLENEMARSGVEVLTRSEVTSIEAGKVTLKGGAALHADRIIVTTGGNSRPETGSTGEGFKWLKTLGHTVRAPEPVLVPITTKERWAHDMLGLAWPEARVSIIQGGVALEKRKGKILFTHFGMSGPLILNMSRAITTALHDDPVTLAIDLYPNMDPGALDRDILAKLAPHQNKFLVNALNEIFPPLLTNAIGKKLGFDAAMKVHQFGRDARKALVSLLKNIELTPTGALGADKAIVTSGGIPLAEIDTKTMESKIIPGIFLAGDVLDIDRPSGGYSLQLCWTTGYVAGMSAAK